MNDKCLTLLDKIEKTYTSWIDLYKGRARKKGKTDARK